jgi:hypothetical protein
MADRNAMEEAASYFSATFITLRTWKGEMIAGLQPGEAEAFSVEGPTWSINDQSGFIKGKNT